MTYFLFLVTYWLSLLLSPVVFNLPSVTGNEYFQILGFSVLGFKFDSFFNLHIKPDDSLPTFSSIILMHSCKFINILTINMLKSLSVNFNTWLVYGSLSIIDFSLDYVSYFPVFCHASKFLFYSVYGGSDGKKSAWNAGNSSLIPGLGRSPGEGNGNPFQYSCLGNSIDREVCPATVCGVAESETSEQLTLFILRHCGWNFVDTLNSFLSEECWLVLEGS